MISEHDRSVIESSRRARYELAAEAEDEDDVEWTREDADLARWEADREG